MAIHKITIVLEDSGLDGKSMKQNASTNVESTFSLENSRITKEVANISRLCFRQTHNSNCNMLLTGYEQDNEWYGDRPDDGIWTNPFTNKQYKRTGTDDVEYVEPPLTIRGSSLLVVMTDTSTDIVKSNNDGVDTEDGLVNVTLDGVPLNIDPEWKDNKWTDIKYVGEFDYIVNNQAMVTTSQVFTNRPQKITLKFDLEFYSVAKNIVHTLTKISEKNGVTIYVAPTADQMSMYGPNQKYGK